ncbi:MAG: hypothetical protein ABI680_08875 [Chthoniobacteraceae bacterium]
MTKLIPTVAGMTLGLLTACDRNASDVASVDSASDGSASKTAVLSKAVDDYSAATTPENEALVEKAFADLDGKIAKLDGRVATTQGSEQAEAKQKAADLRVDRIKQRARFAKVKTGAVIEDLKPGVRAAGEKLKEAAKDVGASVSEIGEKLGDEIRDLGHEDRDKTK